MSQLTGAGRFAPSPTGPLHLGNLRTALAAWLFARGAGLPIRLRIDDLDPDRSREQWVDHQCADLAALGLDWDGLTERQSLRLGEYDRALESLAAAGDTYPCFCSRADVREAATAPHGAVPDGWYPGTCSTLSTQQVEGRLAAGDEYSVRVRAKGATVAYDDLVLGGVSVPIDDFVVRRRDGVAAYNLACAVDDGRADVGHVVRGADLAETTARQLWLMQRLSLDEPTYAHVPIVVGADRTRLAKRHGAVTLGDLAERGWSIDDVRDLLVRSLGVDAWTAGAPLAAAVGQVTPESLPSEPLVFTGDAFER